MRRGGRSYWRMVRLRERNMAARPLAPNEYRGENDYDRADIMAKVDSLSMGWRMLINQHGFTPVMQARNYSTDIAIVEKMMNQRHEIRQEQLAKGRA